MSLEYLIQRGEDFVYHAAGWEKEDHKYVAKVPTGNLKYPNRYFYTLKEYITYLKSHNANPSQLGQVYINEFMDINGNTLVNGSFSDSIINVGKLVVDILISGVGEVVQEIKQAILKPLDYSKLDKKNKTYSADEDMAAVNPDYDPGNYGTSHNCASCTLAYELRRRGYDVKAKSVVYEKRDKAYDGLYDISVCITENMLEWYGNPKTTTASDVLDRYNVSGSVSANELADCIKKEIKKEHGNRARGNINVEWKNGGAHSMVWEVEPRTGNVIIRDCQTNRVNDLAKDVLPYIKDFEYWRTDNANIQNVALELVENVK